MKYYQNKLIFNDAYSNNKLPVIPNFTAQIKYEAHVMNLDEDKSIGANWIALYVNGDNVKYNVNQKIHRQ